MEIKKEECRICKTDSCAHLDMAESCSPKQKEVNVMCTLVAGHPCEECFSKQKEEKYCRMCYAGGEPSVHSSWCTQKQLIELPMEFSRNDSGTLLGWDSSLGAEKINMLIKYLKARE